MPAITQTLLNGSEILVDPPALSVPSNAAVAALADGRSVITWQDSASGSNNDIRALILNADGTPSGAEFMVNTTTASNQTEPQVVTLADGRFVIAWSNDNGGATAPVQAQVFNEDGSPSGSEIDIDGSTGEFRAFPSLTALANGGFAVATAQIEELPDTTFNFSMFAQLFASDGSLDGSEFQIGAETELFTLEPSVTGLSGGGFVVTWEFNDTITAQIYSNNGTPVDDEFIVSSATSGNQTAGAVTALDDGRVLIVWQDSSQSGGDTSFNAIRAQVLNADGSAHGPTFLVNTTTPGAQSQPAAAALPNGQFVISWSDFSASADDPDAGAVRAQVYAADGTPLGTETLVNTNTAGNQGSSSVAGLSNGRFAVAWEDYSDTGSGGFDFSIRAQLLSTPTFETITDATLGSRDLTTGSRLAILPDASLSTFNETGIEAVAGADIQVIVGGAITALGSASFDAIRLDTTEGDLGNHRVTVLETGSVLASDGAAIRLAGSGNVVLNAGQIVGDVFLGDNAGYYGGSGAGTVVGTVFGGDSADTMFGAASEDVFDGGRDDDLLIGRGGNDTLFGGSQGEDTLRGGAGDDSLNGGVNSDIIFGGSGDDIIEGGSGADDIEGDSGNDLIFGGSASDSLDGGSGNDTLEGGSGGDILSGRSGDDFMRGESGDDAISGGSGDDTLSGSTGDDTLDGGSGNDRMFGSFDNDTMQGSLGDDYLSGGSGADSLRGGSDDDTLLGGTGQDTLSGGSGQDVFVFNTVDDSAQGTATRDLILDFDTTADTIDLSGFSQTLSYIGAGTYSNTAGQVRYNESIGRLYIDIDGDGASDFAIDLVAAPALTEDDLIL